jgi:serine/threonine protein kinase
LGEASIVFHQTSPTNKQTANDNMDRYALLDTRFAKGAYGEILLALEKKRNKKVVIKFIPDSTPAKMIENEIEAGTLLKGHTHIAQFREYVQTKNHHCIVFDFVDGTDLFSLMAGLEVTLLSTDSFS